MYITQNWRNFQNRDRWFWGVSHAPSPSVIHQADTKLSISCHQAVDKLSLSCQQTASKLSPATTQQLNQVSTTYCGNNKGTQWSDLGPLKIVELSPVKCYEKCYFKCQDIEVDFYRQEKLIEADDAMAPISLEYRSAFIILSLLHVD